jgi:hypothetical protein
MTNQQRFSTPFPVCAGTLAPARELPGDGHSKSGDIATANIMYFLTNPNLSVPVVAALAVIVIAIAVICVLRSRQNNNAITKGRKILRGILSFCAQERWRRRSAASRESAKSSPACPSGWT